MKDLECIAQIDPMHVKLGRRKLLYFAGCDYHRLASHPAVRQAACDGLRTLGLNVAASRLTTGNHPIYPQLEQRLREFFNAPSATLLSNGYAAPIAVAQALYGKFTHAYIDERSHACLHDALPFLGCPCSVFPHRKPEGFKAILDHNRHAASRVLLLTDGMFSHDGSVAPLVEYLKVLPAQGELLVDDSHGAGVLGKSGRGTLEHLGLDPCSAIVTVTLSKAFGTYGAAVLGPTSLREHIISNARIFVGNTPLPLPLASASLKSLDVFQPEWTEKLAGNAAKVKQALAGAGVALPDAPGPIISLPPQPARFNSRLRRSLLSAGIYPSLIRYMNKGPKPYFRFVISSQHTGEQLDRLIEVLRSVPALQEELGLLSPRP